MSPSGIRSISVCPATLVKGIRIMQDLEVQTITQGLETPVIPVPGLANSFPGSRMTQAALTFIWTSDRSTRVKTAGNRVRISGLSFFTLCRPL